MGPTRRAVFLCFVVFAALTVGGHAANAQEARFALVIGNDEYRTGKLATPANDAGLVADALQAAGFTVTGARNLDQTTLRQSLREFLDQVAAAGPDAVALVYLAGIGLQFEGDNYFVPVDADIQRDVDVPLQAVRISDLTQPLASLPARVKIVVLDAARQNGFARGGQPLASGLALVDPPQNMAIAFNAAPGTVGPDEQGPYGAYATALTEMIANGGLSLDDIFARVRLRVSDLTQGAEIPWYASQIGGPFFMTERAADAPPPPNVMPVADIRTKPMRDFANVEDAYAAALTLDTIDGYQQFLAIYPSSPYSRRITAMLAVRREEIAWRHCVSVDTPPAYWSYLRRYPNGPHVWDARRRLQMLREALEPPPNFTVIDFGVPPPPAYELEVVDRPIVVFEGPGYAPPPPPPLFFLPPRPRQFVDLPPPPPPRERFLLPVAAAATAAIIPAFVRPPRTVAVRPQPPGTPPGARPAVPVSLPNAVQAHGAGGGVPGTPGTPGGTPGAHREPGFGAPGAGTAPAPGAHPGAAVPPPPAPSASLKPSPPPPHSSAPAAPAMVRPANPPSPPKEAAPAMVKPATPPSPPKETAPAMVKPATPQPPPKEAGPAMVKPATPPSPPREAAPAMVKPPSPPPHAQGAAPVFAKPASPPPHPAPPAPSAAKPAPVPPPPHPQAPAAAKPAPVPPPPHSQAPAAAKPAPSSAPAGPQAKPGCPPGKSATPQGCK